MLVSWNPCARTHTLLDKRNDRFRSCGLNGLRKELQKGLVTTRGRGFLQYLTDGRLADMMGLGRLNQAHAFGAATDKYEFFLISLGAKKGGHVTNRYPARRDLP